MKPLIFLVVLSFVVFFTRTSIAQDTIYVPADFQTIQQAINAASNSDLVLVDEGTYLENINFTGKAIIVASKFIVDGDESHIENTIIDGSNPVYPDSGSVVTFNSGEDTNSVICGFTITGGSGTIAYNSYYGTWDKTGGGITATGGCRISNNIITDNEISRTTLSNAYGGGIGCGPNTIIENNIISNNNLNCELSQAAAAGVFISGSGTRLINNSITDNTALSNASDWNANGGGAGVVFGNVLVSGNYIARNKALAPNCTTYPCYGGGFHAFETTESVIFYNNIVIDNLVQGNDGSYGGGINLSDGSNSVIRNNVIVRNISSIGGGISCIKSTGVLEPPTIMNSTLSLNNATSGQAGGIYSSGSWTPEVANSILWQNTNGTGSEVLGSINITYSDVEGGYSGTGNGDWDPYFRDSTNNDFHLMSTDCGFSFNSNCIDAGDPGFLDDVLNCNLGLGDSTSDMGAYGGANSGTVPVEFISFTATANGNEIVLTWATASELNNHGFEIQRSSEGNKYFTIGFVEGHGTTAEQYNYNYTDKNLENGRYYYRLKQVDFSGGFEYSDVIEVEWRAFNSFLLEQNYPNPFNPCTKIKYSIPQTSQVQIKVFDVLGNEIATLVNKYKLAGKYEVEFNASILPSGVYFYQLKAGNYVDTKKMLLLK